MIAIDLSKQQALDADPKAIQQINFTRNLDRDGNTARRRLEDVRFGRRKIVTLKMSWRRLQDMSWRYLEDISWRLLEDTMETNKILTGDICI